MSNKPQPKDIKPLGDLIKKWGKVWDNLNECNILFQSYIDTILLVHQKIKMEPLIKSFENLKKSCEKYYDEIDATAAAMRCASPVEVVLPWNTDKFREEWQFWKDYLKEQHGIVISSRTETKQLSMLAKITNNKEDDAYPVLDYAIANLYKMFFKLDEKKIATKTKSKTIRKDDDFQ